MPVHHVAVAETYTELLEIEVAAEKGRKIRHPFAARGIGEHIDIKRHPVAQAVPQLGGTIASAHGIGGHSGIHECLRQLGVGRYAHPVGPREMLVASVAHAVKAIRVGKAVVGTRSEHARVAPASETAGDGGCGQHIVHHLLSEEKHRVAIAAESGVFAHVGQYMQHAALARLHHKLGQLHDVFLHAYYAGAGQFHRLFAEAHVADGDGIIVGRHKGQFAVDATDAGQTSVAVEHRRARQRHAQHGIDHHLRTGGKHGQYKHNAKQGRLHLSFVCGKGKDIRATAQTI